MRLAAWPAPPCPRGTRPREGLAAHGSSSIGESVSAALARGLRKAEPIADRFYARPLDGLAGQQASAGRTGRSRRTAPGRERRRPPGGRGAPPSSSSDPRPCQAAPGISRLEHLKSTTGCTTAYLSGMRGAGAGSSGSSGTMGRRSRRTSTGYAPWGTLGTTRICWPRSGWSLRILLLAWSLDEKSLRGRDARQLGVIGFSGDPQQHVHHLAI